jgi:uncharacterized membrane protein
VIQPKGEITINDRTYHAEKIVLKVSKDQIVDDDGTVYRRGVKPKSPGEEGVRLEPPLIVSAEGLGGTVVFRSLRDGIGPLGGTNRRTLYVIDNPVRVYGWTRVGRSLGGWGVWTKDKGWQELPALVDRGLRLRDSFTALTPRGQIVGNNDRIPFCYRDGKLEILATMPLDSVPPNFAFGDAKALPLGISVDGRVMVGWSWTKTGSGFGRRAVRWVNDQIEQLSEPEGKINFSQANAVSGDGKVIVGKWVPEGGWEQGIVWTADGKITKLGDGWSPHLANQDGSIILGEGRRETSRTFGAVRWSATEGAKELPEFPAKDGVPGNLTMPGDGCSSHVYGVSADGNLVVGQAGVQISVDPKPPGGFPVHPRPMVWVDNSAVHDIYALLTTDLKMDLHGWKMYLATDISPDGTAIVGVGTNEKDQLDAWLIELPPGWWKTLPALKSSK